MEVRTTIMLDNQRDTFIDIFKLDNVGLQNSGHCLKHTMCF